MESQEPTQAINPTAPQADQTRPIAAGDARRAALAAEMARLGISPAEAQQMLAAAAATEAGAPVQPRAVEHAAPEPVYTPDIAGLPELRPSSAEEAAAAQPLLREARMLRKRERYREAEQKCREAIALTPSDPIALELLGDILQGVARIDQALAAYHQAMAAEPARRTAEKKYGELLARQTTVQPAFAALSAPPTTNPYVPVMLSLVLPGGGQFLNGEPAKGVAFVVASAISLALVMWSPWGLAHARTRGVPVSNVLTIGLLAAVYVVALIDTNIVARRNAGR